MAGGGTKNWSRVMAEGAAIVASILLAFAIDAWWEERGIRAEEQEVLRGLRDDFQNVRAILHRPHCENHEGHLDALEAFMVAAENGDVAEAEAVVDELLNVLLTPMTSDLGVGSLDALLSSGRIEILQNRQLRAMLAGWQGVIGEVLDDQARNEKSVFEIHIPHFIDNDIPAGDSVALWYDDRPLPLRLPSSDPESVARILADRKILEMAKISYGYRRHTSEEFESAINTVDDILAEIEGSIAE